MSTVDLRSDTVTKPTAAMYQAMAAAELGDNVLERDPTVQKLEELCAGMLGKEEALFVPSGTMGNQVALATHTRPGDSVIFEDQAHMVFYEGGAPAVFAGVLTRSVRAKNGAVDAADLEEAILERSHHTPGTSLICLENTHNRHGGAVTPPESMAACAEIAARRGVKIHLDGARLWNAAVALGCPPADLCRDAETVSVCLSKGLCAPVGSVLCGPKGFIEEAAYWRKRMGGGLRQAGLLAACGIVGLTHMVQRLAEDHARARALAEHCAGLKGFAPLPCPTNIVIVETEEPAAEIAAAIEARGVRVIPFGPRRIRAVFHHDVDDAGLIRAKEAFSAAARG